MLAQPLDIKIFLINAQQSSDCTFTSALSTLWWTVRERVHHGGMSLCGCLIWTLWILRVCLTQIGCKPPLGQMKGVCPVVHWWPEWDGPLSWVDFHREWKEQLMSAVGPASKSPESASFLVFIDGAFAFKPAAARVDECWCSDEKVVGLNALARHETS